MTPPSRTLKYSTGDQLFLREVPPVDTVALIEFASRSLPVKVHLKKNPEVEKLDGK